MLDVNSTYKLGGARTNLQGKLHENLVGAISVRSTCLCDMNHNIPLDGITGVVPNLKAITYFQTKIRTNSKVSTTHRQSEKLVEGECYLICL